MRFAAAGCIQPSLSLHSCFAAAPLSAAAQLNTQPINLVWKRRKFYSGCSSSTRRFFITTQNRYDRCPKDLAALVKFCILTTFILRLGTFRQFYWILMTCVHLVVMVNFKQTLGRTVGKNIHFCLSKVFSNPFSCQVS